KPAKRLPGPEIVGERHAAFLEWRAKRPCPAQPDYRAFRPLGRRGSRFRRGGEPGVGRLWRQDGRCVAALPVGLGCTALSRLSGTHGCLERWRELAARTLAPGAPERGRGR